MHIGTSNRTARLPFVGQAGLPPSGREARSGSNLSGSSGVLQAGPGSGSVLAGPEPEEESAPRPSCIRVTRATACVWA